MRICFLAPANNYHTKKWCKWFSMRGHEIHVVSFVEDNIEHTTVHYINTGATAESTDSKKIKYLLKSKEVNKAVKAINPDIINVHYATSYGTVAALAKLDNYILSVWGSDIYDFPRKSFAHKMLLKYSLKHAKYLFSTSNAMAEETRKYTNKRIEITPFGVDLSVFTPEKRSRSEYKQGKEEFVVGTVKALTPKYGIDYLIKATALIKRDHPDIPIKLHIAGRGESESEYRDLVLRLRLSNDVIWHGFKPQDEVATIWANMDLAVVYSSSESFGVSAVEAQACGVPLIISDVPGLMEATQPGESSIVVPRCNEQELARQIVRLYYDNELRKQMGYNGHKLVEQKYDINYCFQKVEKLYYSINKAI